MGAKYEQLAPRMLVAVGLLVVALWLATEELEARSINDDLVTRTNATWLDALNYDFCGQRWAKKSRRHNRGRKSHISKRISGGRPGYPGEFPWYAHITYKLHASSPRPNRVRYNCSGVWIHDNLVLTAAHCVLDIDSRSRENLDIRVSNWKRQAETSVEKIEIHPGYPNRSVSSSQRPGDSLPRPSKEHSDYALLRLVSRIRYDEDRMPICLTSEGTQNDFADGCEVAGWGLTTSKPEWLWSQTLMAMPVQRCTPWPLPGEEALQYWKDEVCWWSGNPKEYFGKACYGDDGAGIFCPKERNGQKRWHLLGIMDERNAIEPCDQDFTRTNYPKVIFGDAAHHSKAIADMAWKLLSEANLLPGYYKRDHHHHGKTKQGHSARREPEEDSD